MGRMGEGEERGVDVVLGEEDGETGGSAQMDGSIKTDNLLLSGGMFICISSSP